MNGRALGITLLISVAGLTCAWAQTTSLPPTAPTGSAQAAAAPAATRPAPAKPAPAPPQDWANLARYRADDAALPTPTPGQPRVVFMGDSITDIWGKSPDRGEFFPGKPYVNRGISGQTTPQMLVRFQQDVIHLHPAVVVLNGGTNDIAGNTGPETVAQIEDNLSSMVQLARANGIKVVLSTITPADHYAWRPGVQPVAAIHVVNSWIRDYCARTGIIFLDYFDAMADPNGAMRSGLSSDGVHPIAAGYAIMGPLASTAIAQALAHCVSPSRCGAGLDLVAPHVSTSSRRTPRSGCGTRLDLVAAHVSISLRHTSRSRWDARLNLVPADVSASISSGLGFSPALTQRLEAGSSRRVRREPLSSAVAADLDARVDAGMAELPSPPICSNEAHGFRHILSKAANPGSP